MAAHAADREAAAEDAFQILRIRNIAAPQTWPKDMQIICSLNEILSERIKVDGIQNYSYYLASNYIAGASTLLCIFMTILRFYFFFQAIPAHTLSLMLVKCFAPAAVFFFCFVSVISAAAIVVAFRPFFVALFATCCCFPFFKPFIVAVNVWT